MKFILDKKEGRGPMVFGIPKDGGNMSFYITITQRMHRNVKDFIR